MKELDIHYNHAQVEKGKQDFWKKQKYFQNHNTKLEPFSIVLPPPNVTGKLHLGHCLDTIPSDIIIRYKKAKGYDVLWLPGVDHAGIATQAKVMEKLRKEKIDFNKLTKDQFLNYAYKWKDEFASTIHKQWDALGLSLDFAHERFTLDDGFKKAVNKVFVTLFNKGLIYQGEKIINYDTELHTAVSNIEVVYKEVKGKLYYFKYFIEGTNKFLTVATTRPETMYGDVCLVANPKDKKYLKYKDNKFINPVNGEPIPLIYDSYVDMAFGTGLMKVTPAHDPNDFNLAKTHKLKKIVILNEDGTLNKICGKYEGLKPLEAREKLLKELESKGLVDHIEDIVHNVNYSERSNTVVEPLLSKQWFIKMKPLADLIIKTQKSKNAVKFIPLRFNKEILRWMNNCEDWCISRQLYWGHDIPVYTNKKTGKMVASEKPLSSKEYTKDPDVLDTWFSSGLWPWCTMDYFDNTALSKRYFPNSLMNTGYDIIFFWVSRMMFQSLYFTKKVPFKTCLIHGLVRDSQGRKMSKSLGNGIEPLDLINDYGCDAMRYYLTSNSTPGQDINFNPEKIKSAGTYLNKIWNSARYVLSILPKGFKPCKNFYSNKHGLLEENILFKLKETIKNFDSNMNKYEFGIACHILYNFVYDDFCSNYLEESKVTLKNNLHIDDTYNTLYYVLKDILLMIYPVTPFITEEIYSFLPEHKESIVLESFPDGSKIKVSSTSSKKVDLIHDIIKDIRNFKSENKLAPNAKLDLEFDSSFKLNDEEIILIKRFTFSENVSLIKVKPQNIKKTISYPLGNMYIDFKISEKEENENTEKELAFLNSEIARCQGLLSNKGFISKAPKEKIDLEKSKLEKFLKQKEQLLKK